MANAATPLIDIDSTPAVSDPVRVRWLGRVAYRPALALQRSLHADRRGSDHVLLLEHPHTVTMGRRGSVADLSNAVAASGAEVVEVDRGGQTTSHGPGQLVGYPIISLDGGALASSTTYVAGLEALLIAALRSLGVDGACRRDDHAGVWFDDGSSPLRKLASIGVRVEHGRTLHGFALNVDPDLAMFDDIVACGLPAGSLTSLRAEGHPVELDVMVDAVVDHLVPVLGAAVGWSPERAIDRADVTWRPHSADVSEFSRSADPAPRSMRRLEHSGVVDVQPFRQRKPEWIRARLEIGDDVLALRDTVRSAGLVTVCEEAGCPNLSECWASGTATFMVCGERCTRACGFCLVDTRRPAPLDASEPERVAGAVEAMGLAFAVLTMVARDDLSDGGSHHVAATIRAIRRRRPGTRIEALVSDFGGQLGDVDTVVDAAPDVFNHNIETPARLQWAARPSAGYARSLAVLGHAASRGAVTKSGLVVGMGETFEEVVGALGDLAAVGTRIVTIGQYLRPTARHLPVARWWEPAVFDEWARIGSEMGLDHVEASPLTRSSYHAAESADQAATPSTVAVTIGAGPH